jgi:hypothetical protein
LPFDIYSPQNEGETRRKDANGEQDNRTTAKTLAKMRFPRTPPLSHFDPSENIAGQHRNNQVTAKKAKTLAACPYFRLFLQVCQQRLTDAVTRLEESMVVEDSSSRTCSV